MFKISAYMENLETFIPGSKNWRYIDNIEAIEPKRILRNYD